MMETIYLGFFYIEPMFIIIVGPAFLLAMLAQMKVKGAYSRMSRVGTRSGYSGADAAKRILDREGITDVQIQETTGFLSDHYDPARKVLRLSPNVFKGNSIASVGIAAHEAGHALQHAVGYAPLKLRSALVPTAGLGSWLAFPMILIGALLQMMALVKFGILLFTVLVLFQLITLPVEFNASSRAKLALANTGIVANEQEMRGVASVLNAAAMTYVAATVVAIAQLLYFVLMFGGGGND
ncbi:MAG: zinc metallopeptidase [Planctomycetota bacterium]|jgi:Zn-dependent membrane protease YugP